MAALVLALVAWQDTSARQHYERSKELFQNGQYAEAAAELEQADKLEPSPILAYNLGLAYEKLARCQAAISAFQRYLRERPEADNRADAEDKIAEQRAKLSRNECTDAPATTPPAAASVPAPAPAPPVEPPPAPAEKQAAMARHHDFGIGLRIGAIFGRIGGSETLTGSSGYTAIEKAGGFHLRADMLFALGRLLSANLFVGLAYYQFNQVTLVDPSGRALSQVSGGSAKLPLFGAGVRADLPLSQRWAFVPSFGAAVGIQSISISSDNCDLGSSLTSPLLSLDVPLRYDADEHSAVYLSPASLYIIFPAGGDGDPLDVTCFGGPSGAPARSAGHRSCRWNRDPSP